MTTRADIAEELVELLSDIQDVQEVFPMAVPDDDTIEYTSQGRFKPYIYFTLTSPVPSRRDRTICGAKGQTTIRGAVITSVGHSPTVAWRVADAVDDMVIGWDMDGETSQWDYRFGVEKRYPRTEQRPVRYEVSTFYEFKADLQG